MMAALEALEDQLAVFQETTSHLQALIDRLANLKFQPGSVPLSNATSSAADNNEYDDTESLADHQGVASELSTEIKQLLREAGEELDLFREEVTDLRGGKFGSEVARRREMLREGADGLEELLRRSRVSFRAAQLTAKRSLISAQRLERSILAASYTRPPPSSTSSTPPNEASSDNQPHPSDTHPSPHRTQQPHRRRQATSKAPIDPVLTASSTLTTSLRRTHTLIASELSRSLATRETLATSTTQLRSLQTSYASLDDMLVSSRDLLGTLWRSQKSDTWYLTTAFYMLVATAGWLVFRRLVYGPMWWFVWLPMRVMFGVGWGAGRGAVGVVGGLGRAVVGSVGRTDGGGVGVLDEEKGRVVIEGIPERNVVPTATVGEGIEDDPIVDDSMVGKVGRIIDGQEASEEMVVIVDDAAVMSDSVEADVPHVKDEL